MKSKCIIWKGGAQSKGYGSLVVDGSRHLAHRVAFKMANPSVYLRQKTLVLHRCDVRRCINPAHLFLGTPKDNTLDMLRKGRWKKPRYHRGAAHHNWKGERHADGKS